MTHDHHTEPAHSHGQEPEPAAGTGWTGYALVKYGIILIIVLAILWFVANYFLGE